MPDAFEVRFDGQTVAPFMDANEVKNG